jgi:hypothetical protein
VRAIFISVITLDDMLDMPQMLEFPLKAQAMRKKSVFNWGDLERKHDAPVRIPT